MLSLERPSRPWTISSPPDRRSDTGLEAINPDTGEYRVVLQGTLDREEAPRK